jgi:hypothetical protein
MLNELRGGVEAPSTQPPPPPPPPPQPQQQPQQRSPPPRSPMLALSTALGEAAEDDETGSQIREEDEPGFPFATREKISWGPISEQSRRAVLSAALSEQALVTNPVAEAEAVLVDGH